MLVLLRSSGVVTIVVVSLSMVCTPTATLESCVVCDCVNTGKSVSCAHAPHAPYVVVGALVLVTVGVAAPSAASVALPTSSSVPQLLVSPPPPAPPVIALSAASNALGPKM